MEQLSRTVGENQKRLRTERNLSLDALARESGVSKSRLGQIERGEANPSISTVWQIANALKVEFSALVTSAAIPSQIVRMSEIDPVTADDRRYRSYPLFGFDPTLGFELYVCEIDPGGRLEAEPHPTGTHETFVVNSGTLVLDVGGETTTLTSGEAFRFQADKPHIYDNPGSGVVVFTMVIAYPAT